MANSTSHVQRPDTGDEKEQPDHLIIWLDKFIGRFNEYLLLKRAFFMTTDPTTGYSADLKEEDIMHSIQCNAPIIVRIDGVQFMLRAFDTVDNCFEAIENNLDKRLFIITSGSKGRMLVPALMTNFAEHMKRSYPIYVFCGNMNTTQVGDVEPAHEWAEEFENNLVMYNDEHQLLERVVLDSALYFSTKGRELYQKESFDSALTNCRWARCLLLRYDKMRGRAIHTIKIRQLDQLITNIEEKLRSQNNDESGHGNEAS